MSCFRGHFRTIFLTSAIMLLRGRGLDHDDIFIINFELSLSLWISWTLHVAHAVCDVEEYLQGSYERILHTHLPLSSCPGMTISSFAMTLKREGGEGERVQNSMS